MTERDWVAGAEDSEAEWEALARYVAGECDAVEAARVRAWIEQHPDRAALLAHIERAGILLRNSSARIDVDAAWQRVSGQLDEPVIAFPGARERARAPWRRTALRVAAAVAFLLAGTVLWRTASNPPIAEPQVALLQYQTEVGQTDTVRLADGSLAVLAPLSRLTIDRAYNVDSRTVSLQGEALFEVQHDARRPFRVRVAAATIEDLGTVFTVNAEAVGGVQVAVMEGMVKLASAAPAADTGAVLSAGEYGVLASNGSVRTAVLDDVAENTAWTEHRIVFNNATFHEVSRELRRWYGVELRTTDPAMQSRYLTATFAGEDADQVLRVVALAFGARIERNGDTAVIHALRPGERR